MTSIVACFIDLVAFKLISGKKILTHQIENPYLGCLTWIFISLIFITAATSFGYFFSPEADGSGIPEVKAILSGVDLPKYLTLKTLICKIFGLICCSGALSIGKEGPHAHLAAILSKQTLDFKAFQSLKTHPGIQTRIMEASIAAGVSAVMAAPLGSVFFSMELTATHYMIPNIIYSLYCGFLSSLILNGFRLLNFTEIVNQTNIPEGFNNVDLLFFVLLGIIGGVVGVSFTMITKQMVAWRAEKKVPWLHKRFRYAWVVTSVYSFTCFVLPFMLLNAKQVLNQLLLTGSLPVHWSFCGNVGSLALFCALKMIFTSISTSVQIPGGVFLPVIMSGAAFGRIAYIGSSYMGGKASVAMFAAVGGGAFVASTCHCLSVSLIIFEMTGQIHYAVPMLLAVIISYSIGSSIGLNIFDAIIVLKKILYLPAVRKTKLYSTKIKDIMDRPNSVGLSCNFKQLRDLAFSSVAEKIVLIDENKYILADFSCENVKKYLKSNLNEMKYMLSEEQYRRLMDNIVNEKFEDREFEVFEREKRFDPEKISVVFWTLPVDFSSKDLKSNRSPISVEENTSLYKIHYLFLMLGLMQLYITKEYKITGVIYRHYFTNPKKS
jgi:chloride channel 2